MNSVQIQAGNQLNVLKLQQIIIKELIMKENKPIEVWLYSPCDGILFGSTLLCDNKKLINKKIRALTKNCKVEEKIINI